MYSTHTLLCCSKDGGAFGYVGFFGKTEKPSATIRVVSLSKLCSQLCQQQAPAST